MDLYGSLIVLLKLGLAFALALPVGWDREKTVRSLGLRTFPTVSMASCGYVLLAMAAMGNSQDAGARLVQGLITGIGFLGGGAILKNDGRVSGTATAASIWTTGAVGAAIALDQYVVGVGVALINFLTLRFLTPIQSEIKVEKED
jgi:putative Mg2+ transporter-C (MgtC) family protein